MITCEKLAQNIKDDIRKKISKCSTPYGLAVIQIGEDSASSKYINGKKRDCVDVGISFYHIHLFENVSFTTIKNIITALNDNVDIQGIMIQLPIPNHLDIDKLSSLIAPEKDVDGLRQDSIFTPCTPKGILKILKANDIDIQGRHCVIIGRSKIVGRPLFDLLIKENATVTMCHSYTWDLRDFTKIADIVISAVGKPRFITADMIKEGATVIDVGINVDKNGKLCGDVDFENVAPKCNFITPVPKGIGLLTRACLLDNIVNK